MQRHLEFNPIGPVGALMLATLFACASPAVPSPDRTVAAITPGDVKSRIYLVADDSMRGRAAGAIGNFVMTSYIAREMERLGLEPGGENGTWFQTIPMVRRTTDSASALSAGAQSLKVFTDFVAIRPTSTVRFSTTLPEGKYQVVYGGRAGDSSVRLDPASVQGRIIVFDAPLGTNGQPTGCTRPLPRP